MVPGQVWGGPPGLQRRTSGGAKGETGVLLPRWGAPQTVLASSPRCHFWYLKVSVYLRKRPAEQQAWRDGDVMCPLGGPHLPGHSTVTVGRCAAPGADSLTPQSTQMSPDALKGEEDPPCGPTCEARLDTSRAFGSRPPPAQNSSCSSVPEDWGGGGGRLQHCATST